MSQSQREKISRQLPSKFDEFMSTVTKMETSKTLQFSRFVSLTSSIKLTGGEALIIDVKKTQWTAQLRVGKGIFLGVSWSCCVAVQLYNWSGINTNSWCVSLSDTAFPKYYFCFCKQCLVDNTLMLEVLFLFSPHMQKFICLDAL